MRKILLWICTALGIIGSFASILSFFGITSSNLRGVTMPRLGWLILAIILYAAPFVLMRYEFHRKNKQDEAIKRVGGQVAVLGHFSIQARELAKLLEATWHHWNNAGEKLIHPLSIASDFKNYGADNAISLINELRDFKTLYSDHLRYLRSEIPLFTSRITSCDFPSETEYQVVISDLKNHATKLEAEGITIWDANKPLY
jgi:hypothetical protein